MAPRPEVLAQLARMLADDALRSATGEDVRLAIDAGFERFVEALLSETAASDDVYDRSSALAYADERLAALEPLLGETLRHRLGDALASTIETW